MGEENRKSVAPTGVLTPNRPEGSQSYKVTCHSEYHEDLCRRGFIVERILKLGQLHAPDALSLGNILQYPPNRRMSGPQSRSARLEVRQISLPLGIYPRLPGRPISSHYNECSHESQSMRLRQNGHAECTAEKRPDATRSSSGKKDLILFVSFNDAVNSPDYIACDYNTISQQRSGKVAKEIGLGLL